MRSARALAAVFGLVIAGLLAGTTSAAADDPQHQAAPVLGRWITDGHDGVFEIARCGDALCGWLIGMRYQGTMPLDVWKRPQCEMQLLSGFKPDEEPGRWAGSILDPDNGRSYKANIWSPAAGMLKLRGYWLLPVLGETRSWTRYTGSIGPACKLPN